jgi:predicted DNA repair protein MutK
MASGLAALLDDVAGIAKLAAASVDDVTGAAGKAGSKAVGVVVDDAAVTPGYAMGFTPDRELPIIWKIALGSLKNKFVFLLPGALLLSAFAPWAVTPLLMLGGAYLCFEATEKVMEAIGGEHPEEVVSELALSSAEMEKQKVGGAVRTDLILSAEIMAIALANVSDRPLAIQAGALAVVGFVITVGVYGVVALIVKMDDVGVHLSQRPDAFRRSLGRGLVHAMPHVLSMLSTVGTAAMLWVGGGIIVHGLHEFHLDLVPHLAEGARHAAAAALPAIGAIAGWLAYAAASAVVGLTVGAAVVAAMLPFHRKH